MHGRSVSDHTGRWGRCSRAIDVIGGGGAGEEEGKEAAEEEDDDDALGPLFPGGAFPRAEEMEEISISSISPSILASSISPSILAAATAATTAAAAAAAASKRPSSPLAPVCGAPSYMCRWVELDYVDKGEGVCYRLLRSVRCHSLQQPATATARHPCPYSNSNPNLLPPTSTPNPNLNPDPNPNPNPTQVSCLQQLHHAHIVPLRLINLDAPHNSLQLFYEDAGRPLEAVLRERGTHGPVETAMPAALFFSPTRVEIPEA